MKSEAEPSARLARNGDAPPAGGAGESGPVRPGRARLMRPLGRSTMLAVGATLVLAVVAAQLRPAPTPVSSDRPGAFSRQAFNEQGTPGPRRDSPSAASPLPALEVVGSPAPNGTLLMRSNGWRLLDLGTGTVRDPAAQAWPSRLLPLPDGGFVCLCVDATTAGAQELDSVRIDVLTGDGTVLTSHDLYELTGSADPQVLPDEQGPSVQLSAAVTADGRFLLVGRSVRQPPEWVLGLDVVEVSSGRMTRSFELGGSPSNNRDEYAVWTPDPNAPPTPRIIGGAYAWPPHVTVAPDGRHLLLALDEVRGSRLSARRHFLASIGSTGVAEPEPLPAADGERPDACWSWVFARPGMLVRVCPSGTDGTSTLERLHLDGRSEEPVLLPADSFPWGRVLDDAGRLWLWDPFSWWIVRVNLSNGSVESLQLPRPMAAGEPDALVAALRAVSGWVAPTAVAKMLIEPALMLSPDGRRLYALAAASGSPEDMGGSGGILVIDSASLALVEHWAPLADLASVTVSDDGRFVFAAGLPGVDALGGHAPSWQASVTAYDTRDGDVRLVAGQLGTDWLFFPASRDPWWSPGG